MATITFTLLTEKVNALIQLDKRFTYLRTLAKTCPDAFNTLDDILAAPPAGKKIKDLQDALQEHAQEIEAITTEEEAAPSTPPVSTSVSFVSIPKDCKDTDLKTVFRSFIRDLIIEYRNRDSKKGDRNARVLQMKYLWDEMENNPPYTNEELGNLFGCDGERIRQILKALRESVFDMLDNGKPFLGIVASPLMANTYQAFKNELKPVEFYSRLQEKYSIEKSDKKTLSFFLDGLSYKYSEREDDICADPNRFGDRCITFYQGHVGELRQFLSDEAFPVCFETDVKAFAHAQKWSDKQLSLMEEYLKSDTERIEWTGPDKMNNHHVGLKWNMLRSLESRVVRILYDYKQETGDDSFLDKNDFIIPSYNRRAAQYGFDPLPPNTSFGSHKHLQGQGIGLYRFVDKVINQPLPDLQEELLKLAARQNGKVSVDEAMDFAHGINPKYSKNTVESYLEWGKCKSATIAGVKYYIHPAFIDQYDDVINIRKPALDPVDTLKAVAKILDNAKKPLVIKSELHPLFLAQQKPENDNPVSFMNIVKKGENDLFKITLVNGKNVVELLPNVDLSTFDFDQYGKKSRILDPQTKLVRDLAVQTLHDAPGHTMTKNDLFNAVVDYYQSDSKNNLYNVFKDDDIFVSLGSGRGSSYTLDMELYKKEFGGN